MPLDTDAINEQLTAVRQSLNVGWSDFAIYCQGKMMEAAIAGGIAGYSINGRTVTLSADRWERWHDYAQRQAAVARGGIAEQPITFRPRGGC